MSEKLNSSPSKTVDLVGQLFDLANRNKTFKDEESDLVSFTIEEGEYADAWDINKDYGDDEELDDESQLGEPADKAPLRDIFPAMPLIKEQFHFSAERSRSIAEEPVVDFEISYTISIQDIRLPVHMAEAHLESQDADTIVSGEAAVRAVGPSTLERSVRVEVSTCSSAVTVAESVDFTDEDGDHIDSFSTAKIGTTDEVGYYPQIGVEQGGEAGLKQYPHYLFQAKRDNDAIANLSVEELVVLQQESDELFERAAMNKDESDFRIALAVLASIKQAINRQFSVEL
ncbi:MAG: hypothetical protein EOO17_04425 [Chloroflexi bacterium]|nr:MAG: hypothetical protein EOO17_04425 [Chloroflexota bacterium]